MLWVKQMAVTIRQCTQCSFYALVVWHTYYRDWEANNGIAQTPLQLGHPCKIGGSPEQWEVVAMDSKSRSSLWRMLLSGPYSCSTISSLQSLESDMLIDGQWSRWCKSAFLRDGSIYLASSTQTQFSGPLGASVSYTVSFNKIFLLGSTVLCNQSSWLIH